MYIEECYIGDFGVIHDFTYKADKKFNAILLNNGSGKSTFAEFLKAMFYGMPATGNRKNLDDTTRVKYMPWNGSVMYGYVIFCVNDIRYRLDRRFMKREKDDLFKLINLNTGMECCDFTSNIGEELFGVDEKTFSIASFITQKNRRFIDEEKALSYVDLIDERDEDLVNYLRAKKSLEDAYKFYVKTGSRGEIAKLNAKLTNSCIRRDKLESELTEEKNNCKKGRNVLSSLVTVIVIVTLAAIGIWLLYSGYKIGAIVTAVAAIYSVVHIIGIRGGRNFSERYREISRLIKEDSIIEQIEQDIDEAEYSAGIILKTKELLYQARENCISNYYEEIRDEMSFYMKSFYEDIDLVSKRTTDNCILVRESNAENDLRYYSEGMQDTIAFCQKLAWKDLIFNGKEEPFLVLDDPFVNLDDDVVQKAIEIILEKSNTQQVFYFTCQSARMP